MTWEFFEALPATNKRAVYLADSEEDFDSVEALWRDVYGDELGWLPKASQPLRRDRYHQHSVYLIARIAGQAVGTMRLVRDSAEGLPIEQFVSIQQLRDPLDQRLVECQRLMISDKWRNTRTPDMPHGVFAALTKGCLHWCLTNNFSHIIADLFENTPTTPVTPLLAIGFENTGISFIDTELEEPDISTALLLNVGELFSRPYRCATPFYRYLMEPDNAVDVYHTRPISTFRQLIASNEKGNK